MTPEDAQRIAIARLLMLPDPVDIDTANKEAILPTIYEHLEHEKHLCLDALEQGGYVTNVYVTNNARWYWWSVTDKGRRFLNE